jgi:hypothetical protein
LLLSSLGSIVSSPVCTTAGAGSDATTDVAGNSTAVTAADATDTSVGADIGNVIIGDRTAVGNAEEIATVLYRLLIAAAPDNITVLVDDEVAIEAPIAPLAAGGSLVAAAAGVLAAEALATGGALLELFFLRFGAFEAAMGPVG